MIERSSFENEETYRLRLECHLMQSKPFEFDDAVAFLKDFKFIDDSTSLEEVERMVSQLNDGREERFSETLAALEAIPTATQA